MVCEAAKCARRSGERHDTIGPPAQRPWSIAPITDTPITEALAAPFTVIVLWKCMSGETKTRMSEIVSVDPHLMHGTPCFRGTRVPVHLLLDDLKTGFTIDDFLAGCPTVTREQVERYLELAQDLVTECAVS